MESQVDPKPPKRRKKQIRWKPEHYAYIQAEYPTHSVTELSAMFFERFKLEVSPSAIGFKLWIRRIRKDGSIAPRK